MVKKKERKKKKKKKLLLIVFLLTAVVNYSLGLCCGDELRALEEEDEIIKA